MVTVITPNGPTLLAAIKKAIDNKKVETWSYKGDAFTHTPPQWKDKGVLTATASTGKIEFRITAPGQTVPVEIWAIYHGRFIEMLLAHFDSSFSTATATSQPA